MQHSEVLHSDSSSFDEEFSEWQVHPFVWHSDFEHPTSFEQWHSFLHASFEHSFFGFIPNGIGLVFLFPFYMLILK
ncbi:hypothetical protein NW731_03555 [Mycoplasmopsis felis]|uniref:hypothetical protein n=1 Tax=Mycoplasmopsis felis TaxID=33923 RepID=UPI0021E0AD43|nr:hypothetical protein [Mycoplasmopsis felis]MCU9937514.1 hypothetical protein [Mycoplasmopsis felis]